MSAGATTARTTFVGQFDAFLFNTVGVGIMPQGIDDNVITYGQPDISRKFLRPLIHIPIHFRTWITPGKQLILNRRPSPSMEEARGKLSGPIGMAIRKIEISGSDTVSIARTISMAEILAGHNARAGDPATALRFNLTSAILCTAFKGADEALASADAFRRAALNLAALGRFTAAAIVAELAAYSWDTLDPTLKTTAAFVGESADLNTGAIELTLPEFDPGEATRSVPVLETTEDPATMNRQLASELWIKSLAETNEVDSHMLRIFYGLLNAWLVPDRSVILKVFERALASNGRDNHPLDLAFDSLRMAWAIFHSEKSGAYDWTRAFARIEYAAFIWEKDGEYGKHVAGARKFALEAKRLATEHL